MKVLSPATISTLRVGATASRTQSVSRKVSRGAIRRRLPCLESHLPLIRTQGPSLNLCLWRSLELSAAVSSLVTPCSSGSPSRFARLLPPADLSLRPHSGAGPIGLASLLAARAAGATPIVITDIAESRLAFAKTLVPGVHTVAVERGLSSKDLAIKIKETANIPLGLSVALECTGVESSVQAAIYVSSVFRSFRGSRAVYDNVASQSVKFGSTVFVIGVGKDYQSLPFMHMSANEIDLKLQVSCVVAALVLRSELIRVVFAVPLRQPIPESHP